uniref:Uncharacterized protein n=1 Tax=Daphnia magna TaxID=35525 RepID=A0A0P5ABP5_9CRUS
MTRVTKQQIIITDGTTSSFFFESRANVLDFFLFSWLLSGKNPRKQCDFIQIFIFIYLFLVIAIPFSLLFSKRRNCVHF